MAIAESPLGLNLSARPGHAPGFVQQVKSPREGTSTFRELTETTAPRQDVDGSPSNLTTAGGYNSIQ